MTERTMKVERALEAVASAGFKETRAALADLLKFPENHGHEDTAVAFRTVLMGVEDFNEIIRRQDVLDYRKKFLNYEAQGTPRAVRTTITYGFDGTGEPVAYGIDGDTVMAATKTEDGLIHIEKVSPEPETQLKAPRILTLDIEMTPNLAFVWGLFNQNIGINQISDSATMLCWAAKYYGESKVYSASTYEMSRIEMLEELSRLINEADIVIHYNGLGYDMPHIRRELVETGLPPLKPVREIDLLRTVRKQFKFTSNKLDYVSQKLLSDKKVKTGGFELWVGCMSGDEHAWDQMIEYNRHDVVLTEKLYEKLIPWIKNPPNMALIKGNPHGCPVCGEDPQVPISPDIVYTAVQAYEGFPCGNCGCWIRTNSKAFEPMTFRIAN